MIAKPFDLLAEFGKFGLEQKLSLREPATLAAFGVHVVDAIESAIRDPVLLHGQRVEAMFEELVVSLGGFKLLKPEDGGRLSGAGAGAYRAPDFRIVLPDGANWLVEVKNVFKHDLRNQRRKLMSRAYHDTLRAYADATRAELKLAVYWARWSIWTLVTPQRFTNCKGDVVLDMTSAVRGSEFGALGDCTIGTRPPLRLRLRMDAERTSPTASDGQVRFVVESVSLHCGGSEVTELVEQKIAWLLIQHGEWPSSDAIPVIEGDRLVALEFQWKPEERANEDFEIIGSLSRIFARHFTIATLKEGEIVQLRAPLQPGWFKPLIGPDYSSKALPLWRFRLHPTYADGGEAT